MDLLLALRTTILMAFRTFPLIMISFIGFLAVGLGNLGLFFLFVGHAVVIPIATMIAHMLVPSEANDISNRFHVASNSVGQLVATAPYETAKQNVAPSYWMIHTIFLFSYIFSSIASIPAENTTRRSTMIMITIPIITFALICMRYATHTETFWGMIIAILLGTSIGYGWHKFALLCGPAGADVFGFFQEIIPTNEKPMTCVYAPTA